jgi:hypothetical protein
VAVAPLRKERRPTKYAWSAKASPVRTAKSPTESHWVPLPGIADDAPHMTSHERALGFGGTSLWERVGEAAELLEGVLQLRVCTG